MPPVTALRSPPLSRMTGADSPVIADSSTEAMPSITSPSPGIVSPAETTTTSPLRSSFAAICRTMPSTRTLASVSVLVLRSVSAWALPRPSAIAVAKLAKMSVNHSQPLTMPVKATPGLPWTSPAIKAIDVMTLPTSTTNMTGFRATSRGSSLANELRTAGQIRPRREAPRRAGPGAADDGSGVCPAPGQRSSRVLSRSGAITLMRRASRSPSGTARRSGPARAPGSTSGRRR